MYLKHLELIGFKSFAEKTRLDFEPGITAIVGPNGCGKTNIVDSIRWVLGEQSAKSLRSSKMEDVIFHGTDDRRGISMAEVLLTFDNTDKCLPLEFSEITVSRRGFRSGESQYFINKNLCRLKDVDSVFMDTGIGMSAYSIFEQGKIDLILSSKPEERRFVFEEAAGISKYKERKRETLHKLEITEQNLIRLNDIIKEVQRQLNSIERQAAKARRYKKLLEELKALEVKLMVHQLRDLKSKSIEAEKDKLITEQQATSLREIITAKETKIGDLRQALRQLDAEIAGIQDGRLKIETHLVGNRHEVQYKNSKINELQERNKTIDIELEQSNKNLNDIRSALQEIDKELGEAHEVSAGYKNRLDEKNNEVKLLELKYEDLTKDVDSKKDLLVGKTARQSHIKNELSSIDMELKSLYLKQRRDSVEVSKKEKQKKQLSQDLEKMEGVLAEEKKSLFNLRQKIKDHEEKVVLLKDEVSDINKQLSDRRQYFAEKRSEYEIFSSQKKAFEGYSDGIKMILENKDETSGIIGIVNDLINVPGDYITAISSFLGNRSQWIVVDNLLNACKLANLLHDKNASQAVFLVFESLNNANIIQELKVGVRAVDVISYDKKYKKLVDFLFGRVLIINDVDNIEELAKNAPEGAVLVTNKGIVIDPAGTVSGGKLTGNLTNIVQRDFAIEELKNVLNSISEEILSLTEKYNLSEAKLSQEERRLETARNNLYNEEITLSIQENDFFRHKETFDSLCEEMQVLKLTEQEENLKREEFDKAKTEKEHELEFISNELVSVSNEIERNSELLKEITGRRNVLEREHTEIKICLVSAQEKENLLGFKNAQMQKQIETIVGTIDRISNEKTEGNLLVDKLSEEVIKLGIEVEDLSSKGTDITQRHEVLRMKRQEVEKELEENEEALSKERQATDSVYSQLNERQLGLTQMRLKMDNIVHKLQDEYKMTQDAIDSISLEGVSVDLLEQEISTLKEKIEGMGEVSLVAIEEQDDLVKRYEFLTTQREDLVNAKESLLKAIAKLNTTTKKLFWDTFCRIRENFSRIFCQLFGGGKADLVLIDERDILESGIDIIARPPGKRLQNVSLLSGGEKALTAIALLFSIFKVKPSPFCVMDEMDAPLDDSNIDRFVELLKEFAETSQFIIITHNKRTLSAADALYGITMQESGVSKVVSVKFTPQKSIPSGIKTVVAAVSNKT